MQENRWARLWVMVVTASVMGCAHGAASRRRPWPPGEVAVLVTHPSNQLAIESVDGKSPEWMEEPLDLGPGRHFLVMRHAWGVLRLQFAVEAAHLYRLRGSKDATGGGWMAWIEDGGPLNPQPISTSQAQHLETTCGAGIAASCMALGRRLERGDRDLGWDEARAARLFLAACHHGSIEGCLALAGLYETGHGIEENAAAAADLYEKACSGGERHACTCLGVIVLEGRGRSQADEVGTGLLDRGCRAGDPAACYRLGALYRERAGGGVPDNGRVAALYTTACDGGEAEGCTGLGLLYEDGIGVDQDEARAAALYERGCGLGSALGCANLGVMYQIGLGVPLDRSRAGALLEQGCARGATAACGNLNEMDGAAPGGPPSTSEERN